ncbi:MAG: hypothetical protein KF799_09765 [Bdellovibrionales bacterium]|nr:hypothetical protein [Bdellovibrionales bacterium]
MNRFFKFALTMTMSLTTGMPAAADGSGGSQKLMCGQKLVDQCNAAAAAALSATNQGMQNLADKNGSGGSFGLGKGQAQVTGAAAADMATVAESCRKSQDQCAKECASQPPQKRKAEENKCKAALIAAAEGHQAQSTNFASTSTQSQQVATQSGAEGSSSQPQSSGSGGLGGMGAALMGAAAGGLLGYMLGKNSSDDKKNQEYYGALQENGTIDCSKPDAFNYSDCNGYLSNLCKQKMTANTFTSDPACQNFSQRYCGGASTTDSAIVPISSGSGVDLGDGLVVQSSPPVGVVGEGLTYDPSFCQSVLAHNFCKQSGRSGCPSCLQLVANQAPGCAANPALCMAQNSAEQLNQAKVSCPTDPIFANPDAIKTGSQVALELNSGASLPTVTLPSGTDPAATNSNLNVNLTASTGGGVSTMSVQSVKGQAAGGSANGQAPREGQGSGQGSQAAYGGSNGSVGGSGYRPASQGGGTGSARDVASAGGGGYKPTSAVAGPASDIQGQFGPSVFAVGSQVIRNRCQLGKLNCR